MPNHSSSRREFLARSGAIAGGMALAASGAAPGRAASDPADLVDIGGTGLRTSLLGIGTGTINGREQRLLGSEGFARLIRGAYDRGIRFFDCSDAYQTHGLLRHAIEGLPREELFLQTKTDARDPALAASDIDRFLVELGVEYIDSVLMHCMTAPSFVSDLRPVLDVLLEAKAAGRVRRVGASYHSLDAPAAVVDCADLDIHMLRVNPFGANTDGPPERISEVTGQLAAAGRGVIGMKIYGETGLGSRERRAESLRFAVSLGSVHAFAIGFSSLEQIDETLELIREAKGPVPLP